MNLEKILKWLIYAAALVPLVIFAQYMSPFHFGKGIVFRSIVELMLVFYIPLIIRNRSYLPRPDKILWTLLAFAGAFSLATALSINPFQSFWGTLERMGGLWGFWHYVVFYLILISIIRTKEDWRELLNFTISVGVVSALYGFLQRTSTDFIVGADNRLRIFGSIGNPALFAGYQIFIGFLAMMLFFMHRAGLHIRGQAASATKLILSGAGLSIFFALLANASDIFGGWWTAPLGLVIYGIYRAFDNAGRARLFYISSALLAFLAVAMTAVRGSILGMFAGLVIFGFLYAIKISTPKARRKIFMTISALIVLGAMAVLLRETPLIQGSNYLRRVTEISPSTFTVQTRLWAWEAGVNGWKESPKTVAAGWGPEMFNIPFSKNFNPSFFGKSETAFDRAHNMFIEVLVTMGIIGLITYIALFAAIFIALWQLKKKPEYYIAASAMIGMVVAYLIHNSFIFDTTANFIAFFTVLGFISALSAQNNSNPRIHPNIPNANGKTKALALVLLVGALILIYQTNIKTTKANYASTRGIIAAANNDINRSVTAFREAMKYDVLGRYEYRNQFSQTIFSYTLAHEINGSITDAIKEVISWQEKSAAENPHDYFPELYLARLNILLGRGDPNSPYNIEALKHAEKALSYAPTFVRTYFEIGQSYLNIKNYPKAIEAFQKAVDLNPEAEISNWYLAIATLQSGDLNKGIQLVDVAIQRGYNPSEDELKNLAGLYASLNDYQRFVRAYENLVKRFPEKGQYHAMLAAGYARIGKIDEAVLQAREAARIDPSFEPDARAFVQSLGRTW